MRRPALCLIAALATVCASTAMAQPPNAPAAAAEPRPMATDPDEPYAGDSKAETYSLYRPDGDGPFPLVIMIHGGAFSGGDPDNAAPGFKADVEALNRAGLAVASIGYRLSGEASFPAAQKDVRAAIRYLRTHAEDLMVDPNRFALWGKSAGANLALVAGLAHGEHLFDDPTLGDLSVPDLVSAIVAYYPPVNFLTMDKGLDAAGCPPPTPPAPGKSATRPHAAADSPESRYLGAAITTVPDRVAQADPTTYIHPDAPPILLVVGTADCTVSPGQSQALYDALKAKAPASAPELVLVPGARHADPALDQGAILAQVTRFLTEKLKASPYGVSKPTLRVRPGEE